MGPPASAEPRGRQLEPGGGAWGVRLTPLTHPEGMFHPPPRPDDYEADPNDILWFSALDGTRQCRIAQLFAGCSSCGDGVLPPGGRVGGGAIAAEGRTGAGPAPQGGAERRPTRNPNLEV